MLPTLITSFYISALALFVMLIWSGKTDAIEVKLKGGTILLIYAAFGVLPAALRMANPEPYGLADAQASFLFLFVCLFQFGMERSWNRYVDHIVPGGWAGGFCTIGMVLVLGTPYLQGIPWGAREIIAGGTLFVLSLYSFTQGVWIARNKG